MLRIYEALIALLVLAFGLYFVHAAPGLPYGKYAPYVLVGCVILSLVPICRFVRAHIQAQNLRKNEVLKTDPDKLPKKDGHACYGFGFPWTTKRSEEFYCEIANGYEPPDVMEGSPLLHGIGLWNEQPIFLPHGKRTHHLLVTGSPGEGKTRFLELAIRQYVEVGDAVIIIDPKGDERMINMVRQACIDSGRADRFRLLAIPWPSASVAYNPLSKFSSPAEIADRVLGIFPPAPGDAEAYRGFQWAAVHAVAQAIMVAGLPMSVARILRYIRNLDELLQELVSRRYPELAGEDIAGRYEEAVKSGRMKRTQDLDDLLPFVELDPGYFKKMISALPPQLERLTADYRRELLSPEADETDRREILTWQAVDTGRLVVYCYLGALHGDESAKAIGKMMLLDFKSYIARRYSYSQDASAGPISLIVDEAHHMVSEPFLQILAEARGAGVAVTLSTQTTSQFEQALKSPAAVGEILTQHFAHIQFQSRNPKEAEEFSELAGSRRFKVDSESESYEPGFFSSGLSTVEDFRAHYGRSFHSQELPLVPPWAICQLPTFHFFARIAGRLIKGRVPLLTDPDLTFTAHIRKGAAA